jgi:hypothetical protein
VTPWQPRRNSGASDAMATKKKARAEAGPKPRRRVPITDDSAHRRALAYRELGELLSKWQRDGLDGSFGLFEIVHAAVHAPLGTRVGDPFADLCSAAKRINDKILNDSAIEDARRIHGGVWPAIQKNEPAKAVDAFVRGLHDSPQLRRKLGIAAAHEVASGGRRALLEGAAVRTYKAWQKRIQVDGESEGVEAEDALISARKEAYEAADRAKSEAARTRLERKGVLLKQKLGALKPSRWRSPDGMMRIAQSLLRAFLTALGMKKSEASRLAELKDIALEKRTNRRGTLDR